MNRIISFKNNLGFFLIIFCLLCCQTYPQAENDIAAQTAAYMKACLKLQQFNGSILIARAGKIQISQGYGMANFEHNIPCAANTKFRLGSLTKQFTATAILQLQEKGKLGVKDPVSKYLPDYPTGDEFTIHHLLTHTSGVPSFTNFPEYLKIMVNPMSQTEIIALFKDKPLDFEPGSKFRYSNSGYFLLGHLVEIISGQAYDEYLQEHIFAPLGMHDSGYDHNHLIIKHRAAGYNLKKGELFNADYIHMNIPHGAGALYSTSEDLYKWDRALYTEKILSRASLDQMFTPALNGYGYGWGISSIFDHKRISHSGGINGFVTNITRFPEENACIIILSNLANSNLRQITRDLTAILLGESYELPQIKTN